MVSKTSPKLNATKVNLWLDLSLFTAIMLALAPLLTGIAIHEWLSLALAVAVVVHLLLHWQWIVVTMRRFVGRLAGPARINLVLNVVLFIAFVVVTLTGVLISQEALPFFGLRLTVNRAWQSLHRLSADLIVFVLGLHVALHWKWLLNALQRYAVKPVLEWGKRLTRRPAAVTARAEVER